MAFDAASFFEAFFRELGKQNIPFAILHGYEGLPEQMPSDIDFVVRCQDLPKLLPLQQEIAQQHGWVLTTYAQAKLHAHYAVFFDAAEPSRFIQLDACGHYVEGGCFILRDQQLLQGRRQHRFMNAPTPASEFAYLLAKALIKRKPIDSQMPRLRELWEVDRDGVQHRFEELAGKASGSVEDWLTKPPAQWEAQLRPQIVARTRFGPLNLARELLRTIRRICRPVGMHLVILGPDGVGKSTLIAQLGLPGFRRVRQFHFRPGVLGKKASGPVTQPHAQPLRPLWLSPAKILYYFADHWLGYLLKTYPAKVRNELVIFDRSFEDVFIDPKRYRLSAGGGMARWLNRLLPRADLTIVLDADPEVVHARKPELPTEELRRQRAILQGLANQFDRWTLVSANAPAEQVARTAQCRLITFLAKREAHRNPARVGNP